MREKTGLQRQIREIFGDKDAPSKKRPLPPRDPEHDRGTPRPSSARTPQEDDSVARGAVRLGDPRPIETAKQRTQETASGQTSNDSGGVQMIKQRYRSVDKVKSEPKTKDRLKVFIALSLAGLLAFQLIRTNFPSSSDYLPTDSKLGTNLQRNIAKTPVITWPIPSLYPKDIRDPMEWITEQKTVNGQVVVSASEPTGPIVRGILYSEDKPRAIIGTQLVSTGDIVHGAMVISISRKSVEFEMDGEKWSQEVESLPE